MVGWMGWVGIGRDGMVRDINLYKVSVFSLTAAWLIIQDLSSCICLISFRCFVLFAGLGKHILKFIVHVRPITSNPRTETAKCKCVLIGMYL
jgi:hypothetical protein